MLQDAGAFLEGTGAAVETGEQGKIENVVFADMVQQREKLRSA